MVVYAGRLRLPIPGPRIFVARVVRHQEDLSTEIQDGLRLAGLVGKIATAKLAHVRILCRVPDEDGLDGHRLQARCDAENPNAFPGASARAIGRL